MDEMKRKRDRSEEEGDCDITTFLSAWTWKREHLPDKLRFHRPYNYPLDKQLRQTAEIEAITIHQQSFKAEGFASTVWDSSIVISKLIEHDTSLVFGKRVCDVSAGTGLVGILAAMAGAKDVISTDLADNLSLIDRNIQSNGVQAKVASVPLKWGTDDVKALELPFDLAIACDVMYIVDAVEPLAATLAALIGRRGRALVAHGRNCCAEDAFVAAAAAAGLTTAPLPPAVLHPRYRAQDITVLLLQHRDRASGADEGEVAAGAVQVA